MLLLYLFRSAIPLFKYPFILLFICYSFYVILFYKHNFINCLKEFLETNFLALILVLFVFSAIFISNKLYLTVFKEVIEIIILLLLYFILTIIISTKTKLDYFVSNLLYLTPLFAIFIAIINIHVFAELQNYYGLI